MLLDTTGAVRFAGAYDLSRRGVVAVPDLGPALERLCPRGRCPERSGLLETPFGPMLIAAHSVLPSDGFGTPRGTMIMGRELDESGGAPVGGSGGARQPSCRVRALVACAARTRGTGNQGVRAA